MINLDEISRIFKEHQVTIFEKNKSDGGLIEFLRWQKPHTLTCSIDYLAQGGCLLVKGDYGEAVYNWYNPSLSLEWMSNHEYGYWAEKCKASETGSDFRIWSSVGLTQCIKDFAAINNIDRSLLLGENFTKAGGPSAMRNDQEWRDWLRTYASPEQDNGTEFFGENWESLGVGGWGWNIHPRVRIHLEGLKQAFEWMRRVKLLKPGQQNKVSLMSKEVQL